MYVRKPVRLRAGPGVCLVGGGVPSPSALRLPRLLPRGSPRFKTFQKESDGPPRGEAGGGRGARDVDQWEAGCLAPERMGRVHVDLAPCFCGQAESLGAPRLGPRQRGADGARKLTWWSGQRLAMNRTLRRLAAVWNATYRWGNSCDLEERRCLF
nr:unnamed protein product [Digitaria exilis]